MYPSIFYQYKNGANHYRFFSYLSDDYDVEDFIRQHGRIAYCGVFE